MIQSESQSKEMRSHIRAAEMRFKSKLVDPEADELRKQLDALIEEIEAQIERYRESHNESASPIQSNHELHRLEKLANETYELLQRILRDADKVTFADNCAAAGPFFIAVAFATMTFGGAIKAQFASIRLIMFLIAAALVVLGIVLRIKGKSKGKAARETLAQTRSEVKYTMQELAAQLEVYAK